MFFFAQISHRDIIEWASALVPPTPFLWFVRICAKPGPELCAKPGPEHHGTAGHKPTDAWKGPGTGNKLLKGSGGTLGSVRKSLGQSPGEERPLDAAGHGVWRRC